MDMLQHFGSPTKFRDLVLALISTFTSRVLLNVILGKPIKYGRGYDKGIPYPRFFLCWPLMLFTTPYARPPNKENRTSSMECTHGPNLSLFIDGSAFFVAPNKNYINSRASILEFLCNATDIVANCPKRQVSPIRRDGLDLVDILQVFPATESTYI
jgi:hypothetical protein